MYRVAHFVLSRFNDNADYAIRRGPHGEGKRAHEDPIWWPEKEAFRGYRPYRRVKGGLSGRAYLGDGPLQVCMWNLCEV